MKLWLGISAVLSIALWAIRWLERHTDQGDHVDTTSKEFQQRIIDHDRQQRDVLYDEHSKTSD